MTQIRVTNPKSLNSIYRGHGTYIADVNAGFVSGLVAAGVADASLVGPVPSVNLTQSQSDAWVSGLSLFDVGYLSLIDPRLPTPSDFGVGSLFIGGAQYYSDGQNFNAVTATASLVLDVVNDYGAVVDGITDNSSAIQAAIDDLDNVSTGQSVVYFPPANAPYVLKNINLDGSKIRIDATQARLENQSTTNEPMFILGNTSTVEDMDFDAHFIKSLVGAGPVFQLLGSMQHCRLNVNRISHLDSANPILNSDQITNSASRMYFNRITGIWWFHPLTGAVPAINIQANGSSIQSGNTFDIRRHDTNAAAVEPIMPFYEIRNNGGYNYANHITGDFEKTVGGCVHLYSCAGTVIRDCFLFDLHVNGFGINNDLFLLSRGAGLQRCENNVIENVYRTSGTLDAGIFDINQGQGQLNYYKNVGAIIGNFEINMGGLSGFVENTQGGVVTNTNRTRWTEYEPLQESHTSNYTIPNINSPFYYDNAGATGTLTFTLPAATRGREVVIERIASQIVRADPAGTEKFSDQAAGLYKSLDTDGAYIALKCFKNGVWGILDSDGTITSE